MGNLVIENPLDSILVSQPLDYKEQENLQHEVQVKTGDFVMFPGWIRHHVQPNTTDEDRLILGLHFGSKGSYISGHWASV
jgi:ectoine hydroxylase-related dioxygenase (phytanoyl-CoA dioxygenase family)